MVPGGDLVQLPVPARIHDLADGLVAMPGPVRAGAPGARARTAAEEGEDAVEGPARRELGQHVGVHGGVAPEGEAGERAGGGAVVPGPAEREEHVGRLAEHPQAPPPIGRRPALLELLAQAVAVPRRRGLAREAHQSMPPPEDRLAHGAGYHRFFYSRAIAPRNAAACLDVLSQTG